ncbi:hypothetical protein GCM10027176_72320 [Actinoallomurus bryophytorum]|uniref:Uncharacterized membrane protein YcaP (DUF421 family) n=1 Tax=Actinoallomurus bryophytorum TaxID=1490222 RepID=A0A543CVF3_9ACTN|nr:YetF domain-containing protein [Actinoallomurus bryophytorum]TQM01077.1 uncharacterized membrane protein YcaP (DUF421 family) [Actinoallomurus bryophytorum]
MWHDMLSVQIPIVEKVLRTVAVYVLIVLLFRVAGKRGLANLNTFDFVVIFLLSNVVQNAIIGSDNSLLGGVIGAVTLVAINALLNRWLAVDERAVRLLEGTPTTVIDDGLLLTRPLKRLGLRPGEVEHAIRVQNGETTGDVALGRLDPDGQFIIVLKSSAQNATRGDVAELETRLAAIEELLSTLAGRRPGAPRSPE